MESETKKIKILENEISLLRGEITELRQSLINQKCELQTFFKKQQEDIIDGIKNIMLTLENERLNNQRLIIEIDDLRDKNERLIFDNNVLKSRLKKYDKSIV